MELVDDTALRVMMTAPQADIILKNIERSELLSTKGDSKELLVYWGHTEATYLAWVTGKEMPSPIIRDYNWPGLYKPFDHQIRTSSFMTIHRRAFCFNEAGTGKTASMIWAADYLMNLGVIKRVLVVCPLSIVYTAWQADVFSTAMHRTAGVAAGPREKRVKVIRNGYDFTIMNFDGVTSVEKEIIEQDFDLIIVDEANAYKNSTTVRWKTMARILKPTTRLWMLTGTPAAQSPEDAFGMAKLVSPDLVPRFKTAWRDKVMTQITRFKWVPKPTAKTTVFNALQPAVRYTKAECLDLPEVVYQTRDVPLTPQVVSYYKRLMTQLQVEAAGEKIQAVNAAAGMLKLLQMSGGAVYTEDGNIVEFDISPRLSELRDVIDETDNKVIVFVPFRHTIDVVSRDLNAHNITHRIIKGGVSANDRRVIIQSFQNSKDPRVLLCQPQSTAHGMTLTAADTVVFWSPVMSVDTYIQCIGRIDRVGQKNGMTVVHLQGSAVERKVYTMLRAKVDSHLEIVDLYKQVLDI